MKTSVFVLVLAIAPAACSPAMADSDAAAQFGRAFSPVFELDMPTTLARLKAIDSSSLNPEQARVRACVLARFGSDAIEDADSSVPAPANAVLTAYRRYWTALLMRRLSPVEAETTLSSDLAVVLGTSKGDLQSRSQDVARLLSSQGLYVLGGITPPLHELMIWRRQTMKSETVALPSGTFEAHLALLDDFVSLGWVAWASCDRSHTGGWAQEGGFAVVVPGWKLDSEEYRVSLVAHEGQHLSDYRTYPKLSAGDLEYRAKLTELILADTTQQHLLDAFSAEAKRNRDLPHPFASYWLVERMRLRLGGDKWGAHSVQQVREAAAAEFRAHSELLDSKGRSAAETVLPD
jgi:hypothetical protein